MTTAPGSPAPPGLRVGPYLVLSKLGEGGMGVVHLARHSDGRRVALKVLRPHIVGDDEARARLAREVTSLERIRSRWVAEIVDADPWGDIPFVATRYVPGLSLHDHVREEGAIEDIAWFAARLADGLDTVHAAGVLHRDVKPSNVLMEGRAPILIDFGLARVADDPRLTHTGWLLGTPGYLAPEILYGEDATAASDLHSWAATVAFAGLGRPPFGRGPSLAIMDRVRRGEHDLSGLPGDIRGLVEAALAPEAADRPTLPELRSRLAGDLAGDRAWGRPFPPRDPPPPPMTMPMVASLAPPAAASRAWATPTPGAPTPGAETPGAVMASAPTTALPTAGPPPGWVTPPPIATRVQQPDWWREDAEDAGDTLEPPPVPVPERLRRTTLTVLLLALAAAAVMLAPYAAVLVLVAAAWLLRAGSLAGTSRVARQDRRGRRWYDVVLLPLSYPWFFAAAGPGLAVLVGWSGGLALATVLVCFAVAAPLEVALTLTGATLAGALWWGPGGGRFRGPVRRLVAGLARRPVVWGPVALALALGVGAAVLGVHQQGVDWSPASGAPFAHGSWLRGLLGL